MLGALISSNGSKSEGKKDSGAFDINTLFGGETNKKKQIQEKKKLNDTQMDISREAEEIARANALRRQQMEQKSQKKRNFKRQENATTTKRL